MRLFSSVLSRFLPVSAQWRWALVLVLAVHFLLSAAVGLSVDEAHYALYAAHPAWSYFDHPPLVGWVQWPLVALDAPVVLLRLVPGALWLVTVLLVVRVAEALRAGSGAWALMSVLLAPLLHVLAIGLLPDTLLMLLTAALMHQCVVLMRPDAVGTWRHWIVLGVLLGLAGLSKYTAIFSALAVAACLIAAHGWQVLRSAKLWGSVGIAVVLVLPVAYWNWQNQWISFTYQAKHGAGGSWQVLHLARFLLVQALAFGPLLWWGWAGALSVPSRRLQWLLAFFLIPFLVFLVLSGGGSGLPHWTAPAWVALAPFAGVGLALAMQTHQRRWVVVLIAAQSLLCTALLLLMGTGGVPMMHDRVARVQSSDPPNPFADLHGWDLAGATALRLAREQGLGSVSVQNWTLGSRLGWYARPLKVHVLEDRFDQFDLWAGDLPAGAATLLVDWSPMSYTVPLGTHGFAQCTPLAQQTVTRLGLGLAEFRFFACTGWSGDPKPSLLHN